MDNDQKFSIILEKLSEVGERIAKVEVTTQLMSKDLDVIKAEDRLQNTLLDTHIQGTIANTSRLNLEIEAREKFDARLKKVEKIPQFMSSLYKVASYIALGVGIVYEAGRIIHLW
jgi:SPX domain protein involved in polyphosphate accumulation